MKVQRIAYCLIITAALFVSCKRDKIQVQKEGEDYRAKWEGSWNFTTIDNTLYYFPPDTIIDTTIYTGYISIYDTNKLKIVFKPNASEPRYDPLPVVIRGIVYPTVDESGMFSYPEVNLEHGIFRGFISTDTLYIHWYQTYGHAADAGHTIIGKR